MPSERRSPEPERAFLRSRRFWALALVVAGSALAIGSVHPAVFVVVAVAAVSATAYALFASRRAAARSPALVLFGLAAFTALQATPAPRALLARVAPANASIWAHAAEALGASAPAWLPLSADPGASFLEALKWLTYGCVFVLGAALARREGPVPGALVIIGTALAVTVLTFAHTIVGATKLYGFYEPSFTPPAWGLGPLLNANNLTGYLNVATFAVLGLLLEARPALPRRLLALLAATFIGLNVVSASRGGTAALLVGVAVLPLALRGGSRERARSRRTQVLVSALVALGAGALFAALGSTRATLDALFDSSLDKLTILPAALGLTRTFGWLGIGRGAFDTVFPSVWSRPGLMRQQYPENFLVQWVVEWGLPVTVAALSCFALTFRSATAVKRRPLTTALGVGLFTLLFQNLSDVALEVPAVAILASLTLATLWGAREPRRRDANGRARAVALVACAAPLVYFAATRGVHTAYRDRLDVHAALDAASPAKPGSSGAADALLAAAVWRHPADPYFPMLGALTALERGQDPIPWANQALTREPGSARAHLLVGYYLTRRGATGQGFDELRRAVAADPALAGAAARIAASRALDPATLRRAVPPGAAGAPMLTALARALPRAALEARVELIERAVREAPGALDARRARVTLLLGALEEPGPCAGARRAACVDTLTRDIELLIEQERASTFGIESYARLSVALGEPARAVAYLRARCGQYDARVSCLRLVVELLATHGSGAELAAALSELTSAACVDGASCAAAHARAAQLYLARQNPAVAASEYAAALRASPSPELWLSFAQASRAAGHAAQAKEALLRARRGASPALLARIEEEAARQPSPLLVPH